MDARRRLIGIAAALAIGLALLQPPGGAAAAGKDATTGGVQQHCIKTVRGDTTCYVSDYSPD